MRPPVRPPRLRCGLFPSIYLPHLLVLPATFGLRCFLPSYPYFPALYVVSVRQVRGLPTASFRFHLTVNTLAVQLCASSLPTRTRDFHPLEPAHGGRTRTRRSSPIASPPVPPMTKILMMKMSNSFVRGSSRRPVSAFLLSRISRAIMQYQHAGSAFYKWPFQSDRQQCQIQSKQPAE